MALCFCDAQSWRHLGSVNFQGSLSEVESADLLDFFLNVLENFRDVKYDGCWSRGKSK